MGECFGAQFWFTYKVTGYRTANFQADIQELRTRALSGHFRKALPIAPDTGSAPGLGCQALQRGERLKVSKQPLPDCRHSQQSACCSMRNDKVYKWTRLDTTATGPQSPRSDVKIGGFPSTEKPVKMAKVECEGPDPTQLGYIQSPERGVGQYLAVNCPSQSPELSIPRI